MEGYIAQIIMFAGNFAPRAWAYCHGQIISIAENTALFSLLGTTYGGNGQTTFALPDLRGRVPVGTGQGPGLSFITLGEVAGQQTHTLIITEMPSHNHTVNAVSDAGDASTPQGNYLAHSGATDKEYKAMGASVQMNPGMISSAGNNQPFNIMQPYTGMNYVICMAGIYPSRN